VKPRVPFREKVRELIVEGAERAKLALIPGGQERRKAPRRTSGPHDGPWWDDAHQRRMNEQYGSGNEPPPAA
jgi:hypothetical protein